ncbi:MAG: biosynthetic-type acetolactate synthase large subunit [Anaeromicrobium sp.]|jgi:acetolactate synthase-1/2/3 large subunit|uniref:biosynthetic-type acetolactate synthase large subunit n=1 Tax=Anaeromicrobium sp. TaxID=1929132 RepID=UPI0025EBD45E|nr:biosynthetic-type acetolactate synthase large subunit [Anaeromicrobium sp.]MCT4595369.1 biosynthetic-type acetolactate synthase large subunit [Anaeromicrobium sp.]
MNKSGSQIVLQSLRDLGVDTLFGYPGGAVIPLYDALYDETDHFNHIRTAHEQSAVHGADGYSRCTGKVGVCIVTSGPGATNAITGIANAYLDSVPLLVISGQVPCPLLGKDSFQEVDVTGITMGITKKNYLVRNIEDLEKTIKEALSLASTGRKGPVLIDIPKDVFLAKTEYKNLEVSMDKDHMVCDNCNEAIHLLKKARQPVIMAGGGIKSAGASKLLVDLAQKLHIPVLNTLMGLGTIDRNHELSYGLVGMHGSKEANLAVKHCDLLLAIGTRFSDRVIGNPKFFAHDAKIIHFEIDITELDKNLDTYLHVTGDLKVNLEHIYNNVDKKYDTRWADKVSTFKSSKQKLEEFNAKLIIDSLNKQYEDAFVVTDVGQHQMWTAQHWNFKRDNSFITSGGLGTMGFGIGAAIGTQVGNPNDTVILFTGDGSFRMCAQELLTISKYNLPIKIILFNNHSLGMVRQWQDLFQDKKFSETTLYDHVDYIKLCDAFGIKAYKAENNNELQEVLEANKDFNGPILIECVIDNNQFAYPIIPPGQSVDHIMEG